MDDLKPMLAASKSSNISFPAYVSPKLDGVRCICKDGEVLSRTLEIIPNHHIRKTLSDKFKQLQANFILDGELVVYDENNNILPYYECESQIMSEEGIPDFRYFAFDIFVKEFPKLMFSERVKYLNNYHKNNYIDDIVIYEKISHDEDLQYFYDDYLKLGHEGLMYRNPEGRYKFGRSTSKEAFLVKFKPRETSEAVIVGKYPLMKNISESKLNELGYKKKSLKKVDRIAQEKLGGFHLEDLYSKVKFKIGTGFTDLMRQEFWQDESLIGKIVHYESDVCGVKNKPRNPSFKGFRKSNDL